MNTKRTPAVIGAAALALAGLGSPAEAETAPEGLATFATEGSVMTIDGPSELDTTASLVPERDDFAFLGDAGDLVWIAGTGADGSFPVLDATAVTGTDAVDARFSKTSGPGQAWLYTFTGPGIAEPLASTGDDGDLTLDAGTSTIVVLAVDEPGEYAVELDAADQAHTAYEFVAQEATQADVDRALAAGDGEDGEASAQADTSCEVIDAGHVDIGPRFVDGEWTAQLRDDTDSEPVWRDLSDVVLHVPDAALFPIPEGEEFDFLGEAGDEIWMIPQTQQSDVVWPGWNTQDPSVVDGVPGPVDWNLHDVDGPGAFTLFLTGSFGGAEVLFDAGETLPQTVSIPRNTHAHGNWAFTAAGVYLLTVEFAGTTGDGEDVSDERIIQVAVGDATDPNEACNATGGGSGDSDGGGSGGDDSGFLPTTGTGWLLWGLAAAAAAVVVGSLIMFLTRRRGSAQNGAGDAS